MRTILSLAVAPFMALALLIALPAHAEEVDRTDPAAVTKAFLTAYKAKDIVAMVPLMSKKNAPVFADVAAKGEAHPAYNEIFGGWRWDAGKTWDGTLGTVRYDERKRHLTHFNDIEGDEIAVLVVINEDGAWGVDDINSPEKSYYDTLPTNP